MNRPKLVASLFLLTALILSIGNTPPASASDVKCVCGPQKVVMLLFDFTDVKHRADSTLEHYREIVQVMNVSWYRQSYGQMWLTGGEVYGWYNTTLKLSSLNVRTGPLSETHAAMLEKIARTKANELHIVDAYIFGIFAGDVSYWEDTIPGTLGIIVMGELAPLEFFPSGIRPSARPFMHEFGHILGLPDLYVYNNQGVYPMGVWDLMDNGTELSGWSRHAVGWITDDAIAQTYTMNKFTGILNELDTSQGGLHLLRIQFRGEGYRQYIAEVRHRITVALYGQDGIIQPSSGELYLIVYSIEREIQNGAGSLVIQGVLHVGENDTLTIPKLGSTITVTPINATSVRVDYYPVGVPVPEVPDTTVAVIVLLSIFAASLAIRRANRRLA